MQVDLATFQQPLELILFWLPFEYGLEGLPTDVGIGHASVSELTDVGRDAVQLIECQAPRSSSSAAGDDQRAVDVKENGNAVSCHAVPPYGRSSGGLFDV